MHYILGVRKNSATSDKICIVYANKKILSFIIALYFNFKKVFWWYYLSIATELFPPTPFKILGIVVLFLAPM